ncbi:E3 SUMO-protein ligase CBX4-like isoform X2 [Myxocyprinus asiaticus]|nr:E3 SUMO-protein ligase CBX4-like isoform X2 [Myxocyprinus asiaticus]
MGYRKRGPKPKHLLLQVPSFARRSSVLTDFQDVSQGEDNQNKTITDLVQSQQYQLNSKKHHPYQPNPKDNQGEARTNGEKKHYYQLNSKKHHHYQPNPKLYDSLYQKVRETKVPEGWNLSPALQQKWVQDNDSECLSKMRNITMELKKLPTKLNSGADSKVNIKSDAKDTAPANGISSKLKIVKNKNKNGRIVIVMSKYMENGTQAAKIKKGVADAEEKRQAQDCKSIGTNESIEKLKYTKKKSLEKVVKKDSRTESVPSGLSNALLICARDNPNKADPTVFEPNDFEKLCSTGEYASDDQPLKLITKPIQTPVAIEKGDQSTQSTQCGPPTFPLKRCCSDPETGRGEAKRFLSSRSISAPNTDVSHSYSCTMHFNGHQHSGGHDFENLDSNQDEPIDLSCVRSREERMVSTHSQIGNSMPTGKEAVSTPERVEAETKMGPKCVPSFTPFLGNIIITDVTTNCLTVTFKEYVTV